MATKSLSLNQAKEIFSSLIGEVNDKFEKFVITNQGKPKAVLMSYEEYECWLETMEIFSEERSAVLR